MAMLNKIKSIFKKPQKPAEKAKPIQAGPPASQRGEPKSKKVLAGKLPLKKQRFKEAYKILKEPQVSEKATILNEQDKYVFKVYSEANKIETKKAVESLYGVRVKDVNIVNVPRKKKIFRGIEGFKSGYKKAIVTLEKGQKIEILPH